MSLLSGNYFSSCGDGDKEDDIADQPTGPLPPRNLSEALALARLRQVTIPLCPICRMSYEERTGERIDVTICYPSFCNRHRDWQAWPRPDLARRISQVALDGTLWPRLDALAPLDGTGRPPGTDDDIEDKEGSDGRWS